MPLNAKQQQALEMVKNNRVCVITGAPGTGKTFTLKAILEWAKDKNMNVTMAAPTGKASKQMTMATKYEASTIHRMLEPRKTKHGFTFTRNADNLIETDLLVLDETSMITNGLMADTLRAIDIKSTKIVFIGDAYQLPAVGPGAILRDFLKSGVIPSVELTEIQRNSGDIVRACHKIKDAKSYHPSEVLDDKNGFNLRHIEAVRPESIQQIIKMLVTERMPLRGYDPIWDVQVLSPTNKRTILSCDGLNTILQKELNTNPPIKDYKFRVDDKVIQTKNDKISTPTGDEVLVVNGDMGTIIDIDVSGKKMVVEFCDPSRTVAVPMYDHNLLLAYCITTHRAQGSEFPVVIIPVHTGFNFFVNRPWIYTGISRAKEICITVGQFAAVKNAIKQGDVLQRKTMLIEKMREG